MRALAQNVQRTRNKERQERPFLEGVDHSMSEMKIWRRGEAEVLVEGKRFLLRVHLSRGTLTRHLSKNYELKIILANMKILLNIIYHVSQILVFFRFLVLRGTMGFDAFSICQNLL